MFSFRIIYALCLWSVNQGAIESGNSLKYWKAQGPRAVSVCQTVASRSLEVDLNPLETIALSYLETRHNDKLKGLHGERGAIQALPKYWKRPGDKDALTAGLRAWKYYSRKYNTLKSTAGYYNGSGPDGHYAKKYLEHYNQLKNVYEILRFPR